MLLSQKDILRVPFFFTRIFVIKIKNKVKQLHNILYCCYISQPFCSQDLIINSPFCLLHNCGGVPLENLVLDQSGESDVVLALH